MSRVLDNFIIRLKKDIQSSLKKEEEKKAAKYGNSANGNSRLWGQVKTIHKPNSVSITMPFYWKWVDGGRNKGNVSKTGQLKLQDWISRKGLNPSKIIDDIRTKSALKKGLKAPKTKTPFKKAQKQFAFLVARKLKRKGYKGNEFYTNVIEDGRMSDLRKDIKKEERQNIIVTIKSELK